VEESKLQKENYIHFSVKSITDREIGLLKLNFFQIATGPFHHDIGIV